MPHENGGSKAPTGSNPDKFCDPAAISTNQEPQNAPLLSEEELRVAELVDRANDLVALMRRLLDEYAAGKRELVALEEALSAACLHDRIHNQISRLISSPTVGTLAAARRLAAYEAEVEETIETLAVARIAAVREARSRSAAVRGDEDREAWKAYLDGSAEGTPYPEIEPHTTTPESRTEKNAELALQKLRTDNLVRSALSILCFGDEGTLSRECPANFPSPPSRMAHESRSSDPQLGKADPKRVIR